MLVERWTMSLDLDILWHGTLDDALDAFPTGQGSPLTQAWVFLSPQVLLGSAMALSQSHTICTQHS